MVNIKTIGEEALENLERNVKQGIKQQAKTVVSDVKSQVVGSGSTSDDTSGTHEDGSTSPQQVTDPHTQDFIKDLYAPSASAPVGVGSHPSGANQKTAGKQASQFVQKQLQQGKTPEEAAQMESLLKKLHDETYYIPLTQRPKQQQEEERPAEKVEREQMEELQLEEQKKKEKPPPLAVQMGQNKAEQFPGVSG